MRTIRSTVVGSSSGLTVGQKRSGAWLEKLTIAHEIAIEKCFSDAITCIDRGSNNFAEGACFGGNYEQSGETDTNAAGWEAATAIGSETCADCGGSDPAFCRTRV